MDRDVQIPSTSCTPMETEDDVPSTPVTPFAIPNTTRAAKTNAQKQQITSSNTMDRDVQIPSTSSTPMETEDDVPSTPVKPFAVPHTTRAAKTNAQKQREYRKHQTAQRNPEQAAAFKVAAAERQRRYKLRKAAELALASDSLQSTTESSSVPSASTGITQTNAQRQRAFRQRRAELARTALQQSTSSNQSTVEHIHSSESTTVSYSVPSAITGVAQTNAQRQRAFRKRKAEAARIALQTSTSANQSAVQQIWSLESTTESSSVPSASTGVTQTNAQRQRAFRQRRIELARTALQQSTSSNQSTVEHIHSSESTTVSYSVPSAITGVAQTNGQRQRAYRKRKAEAARTALQTSTSANQSAVQQIRSLESTTESSSVPSASTGVTQTNAQRQYAFRQRRAEVARPALQPSTSSNQSAVQQIQSTWYTKWSPSIKRFKSTFLDNDFGHVCSVCDRLWFKNDLHPITATQLQVISDWCVKENRQLRNEDYNSVCNTCRHSLNKCKLPTLAKINGFSYPEIPPGLPPLDPISERLISPRLPFMQVRRLRHDFSYGIIGQVINVPVNVQDMVKCLPRQLDEDEVININIKRNLAHKTNYISGYMSKRTIKEWLGVLQNSSLYRLYDIKVDLSRLQLTAPSEEDLQDEPAHRIEAISTEHTPESEILASRQHTLLWNEEDYLDIAPGHRATPLNIIYDRHAEELSFPSIYYGEPRRFNMGVSVTPYMIATSEIRRRDRRGATPQKVLYVAMKILRLRMVDGIYSTFRKVPVTENVTRRMLEDPEFLKEFVIQNLAFMKSVPNSVQYWASRKRDLFAMLRQLGKPTVFLTLSANEVRWLVLLNLLLKLSNKYPGKVAEDLNTSERCRLVSDDPVTCCIYFHKLVGTLMRMLKAKQSYNPFGKYFVKDYFLRIEFQHRGSPHAHILLWLNNDPGETVSENMPKTIELVEKLSSVAKEDVPNDTIYANQIHKHTFTCTKRGETTCRFGIPYWPMLTTRVLVPMPQTDGRRLASQKKSQGTTNQSRRTYIR